MTKIRFCVLTTMVFLLVLAAIIVAGNPLWLYVDIASLILVIIPSFLLVGITFPLKEQKACLGEIFSSDQECSKSLLDQSLRLLKHCRNILILNALVWTIIGGIGIGAHLESPEVLGLNFGVLMIVPLYTLLILLMVIEPLKAAADKKHKNP